MGMRVKVNDPARAGEVATAIDNEFANSPYETKAEPEGRSCGGLRNRLETSKILIAILSAVFFTILLVAGNTMAQAVQEQIGGIKGDGVYKRIGARVGACGVVPDRRGGRDRGAGAGG